jgi:glycosyltransferase involved in cell wall biosynthesis
MVVLPSVERTLDGEASPASELLGQTLLEAMSCAKPAICTNVGGMPEIVIDRETGLIVPPGDAASLRGALQRLRDDPALARQMGEKGRRRVVECFAWDDVVRRCFTAYTRALSAQQSVL